MKIAQLLNADFNEALKSLGRSKLDMTVSYSVRKLIQNVNAELNIYNAMLEEARQECMEGEKINEIAFLKRYQELVNIEVEISPKIDIKDIMKKRKNPVTGEEEEPVLSAKDLMFLEPVLLDSEAEAEAAARAERAKRAQGHALSKKQARPSQEESSPSQYTETTPSPQAPSKAKASKRTSKETLSK